MNAPLPHQVQPLAVPPLATQAPVCPRPGYGVRGQCPAWAPPPRAPRSPPRDSIQPAALPTFPIVCSVRQPPWEGQPGWRGPSCQASSVCRRIRRNLLAASPWGAAGAPGLLWEGGRAVGKIRTGSSAATHALVTLQAAGVGIIFIYNLFDHPASERVCLV